MSLNDTIDDLVTDTILVTRQTSKTFVNGIATAGSTSTLTIDAVVQPAFNLNRVIGGANLYGEVDGQHATDVRQLWTRTLLYTRSPTTEPDMLTFQGRNWTVARVEKWVLGDQTHYHVVASAQTGGAA